MKKYNIQNYIMWKRDLEISMKRLPEVDGDYTQLNREQLITMFCPLVENLARKFSI